MKRVVITGSAGLIGGHLGREIERRWPDAFIQRVDLKNGHDCRAFFARNDDRDWDLALHCAAITGGIEGTTYNSAFQGAQNAQTDGSYLEWAMRVKPHRIVYFSSSCAYPMGGSEWGDIYNSVESDIDFDNIGTHPDNVYGWGKLNGEVMANAVRETGINVSIVRPFAIYGSEQENCRMIPAFIERAMTDGDALEVWGPGNQASDFCHASDCAKAILTMATEDIDGPVNICTGRGAGADEVAEIVMDAVGVKRPIVHNMDRPYGPAWRVGDPALLRTFYKPTVTLEEGVAMAVDARR